MTAARDVSCSTQRATGNAARRRCKCYPATTLSRRRRQPTQDCSFYTGPLWQNWRWRMRSLASQRLAVMHPPRSSNVLRSTGFGWRKGSLRFMGLNGYTAIRRPMNSKVRIHRAGPEDIAEIAPLFDAYRTFYGQPSNMQLATHFIRDRLTQADSVIFLAHDARGRPVGFAQLYPTYSSVACRRAYILNDLYTEQASRGKGIGRSLLAAARDHVVAADAATLVLETSVDNVRAQSLYVSFGFERVTKFCAYALDLRGVSR